MNIFSSLKENFKLSNHIKIGTLFSGIGTPEMALNELTNNYEIVFRAEIDHHANNTYTAIHGDILNLGNIKNIESLPYVDILHHSPPCTDLSKAGKMRGAGENTKSGLMYETIRILNNTINKPKVIIMEQVKDLLENTFKHHYVALYDQLHKLGYETYTEILNAKHYEIPQNRERLYMVSILGDYNYDFPKRKKLINNLSYYLEDKVSTKYYLSWEKIKQILHWKSFQNQLENLINVNDTYIRTITAKSNTSMNASMLLINDNREKRQNRIYNVDGIYPCITTKFLPLIKENTKLGYDIANNGDGLYIDRNDKKRGVVQHGLIPTLKTKSNDIAVMYNDSIRKITPLETWRLMGIKDEYFFKASKVCKDSQLYKQAGNAIVVNVYKYILKEML